MLFEELGKLKRTSIMTAIMLAAVAVVMIMCPAGYVESFVSVLGYGMIILAAVWVLQFISGRKSLMKYIILTGALIIALLGLAVLFADEGNTVRAIGLIFGLVLIADGIISIINAWMYARRAQRKGWWVLILLSVLLIAFGLIILINPWWSETIKLFDVIGGMLLFSSLVSIVRLFMIWPIKGEKEG